LVEVAETTLDRDQGEKRMAHSAGGISVDWIVNLVDHRVEVYTQPGPNGYGLRQDYTPGQELPVVVGAVECGRLAVSDILP
jgi:Uma2 family endonuclease